MVFPKANLPTASQPWGRFVESSIKALEVNTATEKVNNAARDAQAALSIKRLDASVAAVAAATIAAQQAADDAAAAIAAVGSLDEATSTYKISADNVTVGTLSGITLGGNTIKTAASGTRVELAGTRADFYFGSSNVGYISGGTSSAGDNGIVISANVANRLFSVGPSWMGFYGNLSNFLGISGNQVQLGGSNGVAVTGAITGALSISSGSITSSGSISASSSISAGGAISTSNGNITATGLVIATGASGNVRAEAQAGTGTVAANISPGYLTALSPISSTSDINLNVFGCRDSSAPVLIVSGRTSCLYLIDDEPLIMVPRLFILAATVPVPACASARTFPLAPVAITRPVAVMFPFDVLMAKAQWPIDGKFGVDFSVTSAFGWRMHPVRKVKAHHNGVDLWGPASTIYIESMFDGTVIFAGPSSKKNADGSVGGFGYHVQVRFQFRGDWYVATFAHMKQGSIKVKKGQKIEAGTVLGIMGATGMVDGRHLHLEITKGKTYKWTDNGVGFIDPIEFIKAAIRFERTVASASAATSEDAPVAPAPVHDEAQAEKIKAEYEAKKAKPTVAAPAVSVKVESKSYTIKAGDSYWSIAAAHPVEGKLIADCVKRLQDLNNNKALHPGETLKLY